MRKFFYLNGKCKKIYLENWLHDNAGKAYMNSFTWQQIMFEIHICCISCTMDEQFSSWRANVWTD